MTYKILPTKEFANDFRKIKDAKAKQAIINKIEEAASSRCSGTNHPLLVSSRIRHTPVFT